ncbi:hypothetical protein V500_03137 [Pseudogymnoascus sp. VKM F-4518 (FW-2643)]|nr:hypothetical protein V500_03137 [Pseudogymnoascus sp. VKM F-4518 (FW-2643)]
MFAVQVLSPRYIGLADIETLPEGDSTKVGLAGAALSRGQRLHIGLARAVYSQQQVLILDDVFSGLDAISEDRIFSRLLRKNGLLRQLGTTVILVTHAAHCLSYANYILSLNLWIKFWTSSIAVHRNSVNGLFLGVLVAGEFVAMVTLMILTSMLFIIMIPRSATHLHGKLLKTIENATLYFFTSIDAGQIVNRFSQDLSVIDVELPIAALILVNNFFMAIIQVIFVCISASYFSIVLPFVLFVMYMLQKFYLRTSRQIRLMDLKAKAPLYSNFLETLNGLVTIRAFGWTKDIEKRNMDFLDASQRPFYLLYCIQRWLILVIDLLIAALAVILVALIVRFRYSADAGFVGLALINIMSFNMTLLAVIIHWTATETSLGAVSRLKSFVDTTHLENLPVESQDVPPQWPLEGSIILSDVSASYALDQLPALYNIDFTIPAS